MPTLVVDGWSPKMLQRSGLRVVSLSIIQLFLSKKSRTQMRLEVGGAIMKA